MEVDSAFQSCRINGSGPAVLLRNGDEALLHFGPGELTQGTPAELAGGLAKFADAEARPDTIGQGFAEKEKFINRDAAAMAFLVALDATPASRCLDFAR